LVDCLEHEHICCATSCGFTEKRATKPKCAAQTLFFATTFFNPQQMFLLRDKLITQGENRETSTKTYNETMLGDKLKVFVFRRL